jgi:GTPase Era involved in 16S rRNA processing
MFVKLQLTVHNSFPCQVFFDTPGLTVDVKGHPLRVDNRSRVRSAWQTAEFCEALIVLVDAHRQTQR